jgi:hypothetical protein
VPNAQITPRPPSPPARRIKQARAAERANSLTESAVWELFRADYFDVGAGDPILFFNTDQVGGGEFGGIVGASVEADDLDDLFAAVLEGGVAGVEVLTVDDDSLALALTTAGGGVDTVLFDNASAVLSDVFA